MASVSQMIRRRDPGPPNRCISRVARDFRMSPLPVRGGIEPPMGGAGATEVRSNGSTGNPVTAEVFIASYPRGVAAGEDQVRRIYRIASALAASATVAALVTSVGAGVKFGW